MSNQSSPGISFLSLTLSLLGVLFVGLKLGGVIDWSWWWVTLPFWGGISYFCCSNYSLRVSSLAYNFT